MQGLILAAGMGKRLGKYTKNNTKCMIKINEKTLLERALNSLQEAGINKVIIVVGYQKENLIRYVEKLKLDMKVIFIENCEYETTNNIYSLYLAREYLKR